MEKLLPFFIYRKFESGECSEFSVLKAGFDKKEDAQDYLEYLTKKEPKNKYYLKERE